MQFIQTSIPGVIVIEPDVHSDERGFFMETFQAQLYRQAGIAADFVQDNHSGSARGALRGLHFQVRQTQGKLVRVAMGEIFDVAVDLRQSSPTFGKWAGELLSSKNRRQLWLPPGFAHGFYVLSEWAEVLYKVSDYYNREWERTLLWNDTHVGIKWPIPDGQTPVLSPKDETGLTLEALAQRGELFD